MPRVTIADHRRAPRSRLRACAAALSCLAAVAGASGCGDERLRADNLERFSLAKSDLPDGYERATHVSSPSLRTCLEDPPTAEALSKLAVAGCSNVSYLKTDANDISKLAAGFASVVLLKSPADAALTMREMRKPRRAALEQVGEDSGLDIDIATPHSLPVSDLGDEALRGVSVPARITGIGAFDFYYFCWRRAKVAACAGSMGPAAGAKTALDLARTIDRRIADGLD